MLTSLELKVVFIEEDSQVQHLVKLLRNAGHDIKKANKAGISGSDDVYYLAKSQARRALIINSKV